MTTSPISLRTLEDQRATSRRLWSHLEAVHTMAYFSLDVRQAQAVIGLKDRVMAYTAGRISPMGPVGSEVATASFYGFAPALLSRALPGAWSIAPPQTVLDTTQAAVASVLDESWVGLEDDLNRAAELGREVALLHPVVGRCLAAAWTSVPWSDRPSLALWQAATRIRESRGDGHVATLVGAGLDGIESLLSVKGDGPKLRRILGPLRGWSDPEWDAGASRLRERGLLGEDGGLTRAGVALRAGIEERTDAIAAPPWVMFGEQRTQQFLRSLEPLVERLVASGVLPGVVVREIVTG